MSSTELDEDLIEVVLTEALESLESALWTLRAIDYGPQGQGAEVVASLFRCFHSIKGNTAMAGRTSVSKAAHRVENVLHVVREQGRALTPPEGKALIDVVDLLHPLIEGMEEGGPIWASLERALTRFESQLVAQDNESTPMPSSEALKGHAATEPASERELEALKGHAATGPASEREVEALKGHAATGPASEREVSTSTSERDAQGGAGERAQQDGGQAKLKVDVQSIIDAMTVAGELFQLDERLKFFVRGASTVSQEDSERWDGLTQISREFDASIEKLYEQLIDIQRLPVSQLTGPLERNVRDICRSTGKSVDFVVRGRDLRIDKNVIQALKDPLMHMVRNACDHGAEMPGERVAAGKPATARVALQFEDAEDSVVVTLSDDGRGMDTKRILEKAIQKGLIDRERAEQLGPAEILKFIYHPGFSTAAQVSELSGRGVGMDVVAQAVIATGGVIETKTELGKGSTFRIEIPKLGSPVVDGLAVKSGAVVYLLPMKNVLCFIARSDFSLIVEPSGPLSALYHGHVFPLSYLPGQPGSRRLNNERTIGVLVEDRRGQKGIIVVDEVLGRRRALAQEISYAACHRERRTGAAILGDGTMGYTIGVEDLLSFKLLMSSGEYLSLAHGQTGREREICAY